VCPGLDHSPKKYSRQWFEEVTEKANISNFHWHDLRHTFASRLVMARIPLRTVQLLMGHKRIETTLRYSHLAAECSRAIDWGRSADEQSGSAKPTATRTATS